MLFSVLIPVYNVEKYLRRCVESVLAQSFSDYEIILVDDGSTDHSGAICDQYSNEHNNIKTIHKNNDGLYMARYDAIKQARGEYLIFLDSDDSISNEALSKLHDIVQNRAYDMVVFRFRLVDNQTQKSLESEILFNEGRIDKFDFCKAFMSTKLNYLCIKCIKNKWNYSLAQYHHMNMAEDIAYTSQFCQRCESFYYSTEVLYNYYINSNSITHKLRAENLKDSTDSHYEMMLMLESSDLLDAFKEQLVNEYIKNMAYIVSELRTKDIQSNQLVKIMTSVRQNQLWSFCNKNQTIANNSNKVFLNLLNKNHYFIIKVVGTVGLTAKSLLHLSNSRKNAKGIWK